MPETTQFDAIVLGAGQAGVPLSQALANSGLHTALIEREHVGGTCVNEGCTPTKTMIASGRVAYLARRGASYGVNIRSLRVSLSRVRRRKRDIVRSFRTGNEKRIASTPGLELIPAEASFTGPKTLVATFPNGKQRTLSAPLIFINAGCRPHISDLPGIAGVPYLTSTSIMELAELPSHLLVLGGGYIGLEFAQLFRRLGSRVTILHAGSQLLDHEDPDVAEAVASILAEDGIQLFLGADHESVSRRGRRFTLRFRYKGKRRDLPFSHLLVATGRMPNSDSLALSAAGIAADPHGFISVNEKLETTVPGIYALGDIKGGPAFTHISYDDFRIIRTNLLQKGSASTRDRLLPYCVFIDPQLGRVGLSEREAAALGRAVRVAKMPMSYVARALEVDETRGFLKVLVDPATSQILGAAVLGIEGGEIMAQLQLAMMGKLPYTVLQDAVFAHPTLAECLNNLFGYFQG